MNDVARKVASGAAETVPWVRVTNLARTIESLKQAGVWVIGTDGDAEETLYEQDLSGPCALVLGSEGAGMRRLTRDLCDFIVKLPMAGSVSSLNVSVAAGVCLFEAVRQRGARRVTGRIRCQIATLQSGEGLCRLRPSKFGRVLKTGPSSLPHRMTGGFKP